MHSGPNRHVRAGVFLLALCLSASQIASARQQSDPNIQTGQLNLEGKYIQKLVLVNNDNGNEQTFTSPAEKVELPVGPYHIGRVELVGDYILPLKQVRTLQVQADKPTVLKIGGPLRSHIRVVRQGPLLTLNYKLRGIGGECYTENQAVSQIKRPRFAVYKDGTQIRRGYFEDG